MQHADQARALVSIAAALEANLREKIAAKLEATRQYVEDATKAAASSRSGALREGIACDTWTDAGTRFETTIRSVAPYSEYQDDGTGIYGPTGARITSTSGKVLRFDWPAAGGVVFAWSVAGAPGTHYFKDAMPQRFSDALVATF